MAAADRIIYEEDEVSLVSGTVYSMHLGAGAWTSSEGRERLKHPHILLGMDDEQNVYLVATSSQQPTLDKLRRICPESIVELKPDGKNGLTADSFLNCNNIRTIHIDDLIMDCEDKIVEILGTLSEQDYSRIRIASLESESALDVYDLMNYGTVL